MISKHGKKDKSTAKSRGSDKKIKNRTKIPREYIKSNGKKT